MFCVIGSINMDISVRTARFPHAGETVHGEELSFSPGGKGANQAVALARLGADVHMIGKIGNDNFGREYLSVFEKEGVTHLGVDTEEGQSTGAAMIEVSGDSQNKIIIVSGANKCVLPKDLETHRTLIAQSSYVLLQLEIPLETVRYAIHHFSEKGRSIILDPAPAEPLPDDIYPHISYITPNESEIRELTGCIVKNKKDAEDAALPLLKKGCPNVVIKAGEHGAYLISKERSIHCPAIQNITAVDTTAAGDTFNAGFAFGLEKFHGNEEKALHIANAAAAFAVTQYGAQSAMPSYEALLPYIK